MNFIQIQAFWYSIHTKYFMCCAVVVALDAYKIDRGFFHHFYIISSVRNRGASASSSPLPVSVLWIIWYKGNFFHTEQRVFFLYLFIINIIMIFFLHLLSTLVFFTRATTPVNINNKHNMGWFCVLFCLHDVYTSCRCAFLQFILRYYDWMSRKKRRMLWCCCLQILLHYHNNHHVCIINGVRRATYIHCLVLPV